MCNDILECSQLISCVGHFFIKEISNVIVGNNFIGFLPFNGYQINDLVGFLFQRVFVLNDFLNNFSLETLSVLIWCSKVCVIDMVIRLSIYRLGLPWLPFCRS